MEPIITYPGGEVVEGYEGEITWFSGGNRGRISRRRQSIKRGGGTIENPLSVKCQSEEGGYGKNLTEP